MPKNKFQEVIFTIIMVFVMVYAMICYNIVLNTGTMTNETFLLAFHELTFMGPIAFILDFFIIGGLAKKIAFGIVDMRRDNPFHLVLAISAVSVAFMCPCMSFAATVLIKHAPASQIIPTWLQTTAMNFPMAFFWQLFAAGPLVRFIFEKMFNINFGDIYKKESAVIKRKPMKITEFLDRLKAAIIQKSKEEGYYHS